jgi:hypothetical protein
MAGHTTLDHQRNYDMRKSLKVTNGKEGIQRREENSKCCFGEIERALLLQLSFGYGPKGAGDMEEKLTMERTRF